MVHPFFQAIRVGSIGLSVVSLCLASLLLYRDRMAFSSFDRLFKFVLYMRGGTQRVFRVAALIGSTLMMLAYIDYFGVFGIYPTRVRLMFKSLIILNVSAAMLAYVYYAAKPCFPFVFTDYSMATKRLKYSIIAFCIVGNICYTVTLAAVTPGVLLGFGMILILSILATVAAAILLYIRLYTIVHKASEQSGGNMEKLVSLMKKWRSFTIVYCLCHFVTLTPVTTDVFGTLRDSARVLPTVELNNFVDPDMLTGAAYSEAALVLAALIPTYMFVWRSWLSTTKKSSTKSDGSSGSVESWTDTTDSSAKSVAKRSKQGGSSRAPPSRLNMSNGFVQPGPSSGFVQPSSAHTTPRATASRSSGFSSPRDQRSRNAQGPWNSGFATPLQSSTTPRGNTSQAQRGTFGFATPALSPPSPRNNGSVEGALELGTASTPSAQHRLANSVPPSPNAQYRSIKMPPSPNSHAQQRGGGSVPSSPNAHYLGLTMPPSPNAQHRGASVPSSPSAQYRTANIPPSPNAQHRSGSVPSSPNAQYRRINQVATTPARLRRHTTTGLSPRSQKQRAQTAHARPFGGSVRGTGHVTGHGDKSGSPAHARSGYVPIFPQQRTALQAQAQSREAALLYSPTMSKMDAPHQAEVV